MSFVDDTMKQRVNLQHAAILMRKGKKIILISIPEPSFLQSFGFKRAYASAVQLYRVKKLFCCEYFGVFCVLSSCDFQIVVMPLKTGHCILFNCILIAFLIVIDDLANI